MSDTNEAQAVGTHDHQPSASTAPDLRVEPQYGPSGGALRRYSADGRFLLADRKLYDAETLVTIRRDAGEQLVLGDTAIRNGFVVRNIETWEIVADFTDLFKNAYTSVIQMSDDGAYLAWFGYRETTDGGWSERFMVLDTASREFILDTQIKNAYVHGLEFINDNEELWVWFGYKELAIFSLKTGERIDLSDESQFKWWTANRFGVAVTYSELPKAPTSGIDAHRSFLSIRDARSGTPIAVLCRPADNDLAANHVAWGDRGAAFSRDGSLFAVLVARDEEGSYRFNCEAVIWETASWKEVKRVALTPFDPWRSMDDRPVLAFDPGNRRLQVGHEEYDLVTGRLIRSFANIIDHLPLARSRNSASNGVVRVRHDGTVTTWNLLEGRQTSATKLLGSFLSISDDGKLVASFCRDYFDNLPKERYENQPRFKDLTAEFEWEFERCGHAVVVQDSASGQIKAVLPTFFHGFDVLRFTPDNSTILAASWSYNASRLMHNSEMRVFQFSWNVDTVELSWVTEIEYGAGRDLKVSQDSALFVRWQESPKNLRVFEVASGKMLWDFVIENESNSPFLHNVYFDPIRPNIIACQSYGRNVMVFNLVTGSETSLPIRSWSMAFASKGEHFAWAGGIRKWNSETDVVTSYSPREMNGVDGVFRGDYFYGYFWQDRKSFTTIHSYRLSDGELLAGWDCGFIIDEMRIVDAVQAGKPATLIALSDRRAKVWGEGLSPEGLAIEFLPAGALLRNGPSQPSWTAEAIPHLRAYQGVREIPLGEFLQRTRSAAAAPELEA